MYTQPRKQRPFEVPFNSNSWKPSYCDMTVTFKDVPTKHST